jgi:hypothetical protein
MAQAKSSNSKRKNQKTQQNQGTTDIEQGNQPKGMTPVNNEEPAKGDGPGQYDVRRETLDKGAASENEQEDHPRATEAQNVQHTPLGNIRKTN